MKPRAGCCSKRSNAHAPVARLALLSLVFFFAFHGIAGCGRGRNAADGGSQHAASAELDQRALESIGQQAWYDRTTQKYRAPHVSPDPDHHLRRDGTVAGPQASANNSSNTASPFALSGELAATVILSVLGVLLVILLVAVLALSFRNWLPGYQTPATAVDFNPARMVDLPFDATDQMQDPLGYAKQLVARGDLDAAIILLYGYMLLALDHHGRIVLHRGKTNRMYVHELRDVPLRNLLLAAMLAFEDVFFGRHHLEAPRFYHVWNQLDAFHQRLEIETPSLQSVEEAVTP